MRQHHNQSMDCGDQAVTPHRIVHVITGTNVGGAETMLLRLLKEMDRSRWIPTVLCLQTPGVLAHQVRALGVDVYSAEFQSRVPTPQRLSAMTQAIRRVQPHVVQGWLVHGNLAALLPIVMRGCRCPVLWNVRHSLDGFRSVSTSGVLVRLSALLSIAPAKIVYNSRRSAAQHEAIGYSARRTVVIPNGIDCDQFQPDPEAGIAIRRELDIPAAALIIGLVARYHELKDHATFLRAAKIVAELANRPVRFLLVGRGVDDSNVALKTMIRDLGLTDLVFTLGERSDIPALTASMDIAVSSSRGEGFSNSIAEAMSCGVPCAATDVGDTGYLVGETGRIIPPANPEALAAALEQLICMDSSSRRQLGLRARTRIQTEFSLSKITAEYTRLYDTVAAV